MLGEICARTVDAPDGHDVPIGEHSLQTQYDAIVSSGQQDRAAVPTRTILRSEAVADFVHEYVSSFRPSWCNRVRAAVR